MSGDSSTRLNKFISDSGLCSRREADRFIEKGFVFINGKKAGIGQRVSPGDRVTVNGRSLEPMEGKQTVFIALNKPPGVTSTTEAGVAGNIVEYVNHSDRIFPIGRLDKDSQGLIFLTNDGDIVNKILRAGNKHEKEYVVTVNKAITDAFIQGMANGVPILGETTKKCKVKQESNYVFRIILIQGLNRQIRRMCEHFGYEVEKLERVRIMNISLKGLPLGDWRELDEEETAKLYKLAQSSSSEAPPARSSAKPARGRFGPPQKPTAQPANPDRRNKSRSSGPSKHKSNKGASKPGKARRSR